MKVAWVGTHEPQFGRNRQLARFMSIAGIEVVDIPVRLWPQDRINALKSRKLFMLARALWVYPVLMAKILARPRPDLYLVSYPGWFDMPVVKLAGFLKRRPVAFDPFISLFDTAVVDRQLLERNAAFSRLCKLFDRASLRMATRVLADTAAHAELFASLSDTNLDKFGILPLGSDETIFAGTEPGPGPGDGTILFYGTFVPLQGVEVLVEAAALVESRFMFVLVGDGETKRQAIELATRIGATNVRFLDPIPQEELVIQIRAADLCLGIFGGSEKADRVIPHKIYECLTAGRAIVTRDSTAVRTMLAGVVAVCQPEDPIGLAELITNLIKDPSKRSELAKAGFEHFQNYYKSELLADALNFEFGRTIEIYAEERRR